MRDESRQKNSDVFSDKEMENFLGLFEILRRVHTRLIGEGYTIRAGEIIPPRDRVSQEDINPAESG